MWPPRTQQPRAAGDRTNSKWSSWSRPDRGTPVRRRAPERFGYHSRSRDSQRAAARARRSSDGRGENAFGARDVPPNPPHVAICTSAAKAWGAKNIGGARWSVSGSVGNRAAIAAMRNVSARWDNPHTAQRHGRRRPTTEMAGIAEAGWEFRAGTCDAARCAAAGWDRAGRQNRRGHAITAAVRERIRRSGDAPPLVPGWYSRMQA